MSQPPYPGPPYDGQSSSGSPYPGQQPPYQGQQPPNQGQPYPGQQSPYQPYPGQPGQPNPDVPSSVPPAYPPTTAYPAPSSGQPYGAPSSGQPSPYDQPPPYGQAAQFGQPSPYGQPPPYGQPGLPPLPPKQKSKTLPIILVAVGIVLVLCVGGTIAVVMAANNTKDKIDETIADVTRSPTPSRTTEPAPDPTTEAPAETIQIVEPRTLGGRPKLTDAQFAAVTEQLEDSLKSIPGSTGSVGALYGTVAKQDIVIVAAAEAPIANPARELDQAFYGAGVGGLKITNISAAPTGSLGGTAKCGSAQSADVNMAICSWADDGSLGMFIWYFKSVSKAKAEFPLLRAQVEKKR